ncbi:Antitoxin [Actinomadura rubteroloni]|uniref:Antitoxin n=1 Tax=Actinomadura rubteroloni TaxID=1926885 RepID=A0A2P4UH37_9ACTN|nr:antitoxin [Actinomadura rubteroloni]POM24382.1 Antitoxin [Actinomadura rubteroloni]
MPFMDKVKEMLGKNAAKARQGVERGGDMIDKRTGGKYADKTDKVQNKANDYIGTQERSGSRNDTRGT